MTRVSTPLGDIADLIRGITFPASAKHTSRADGLIPCLRTSNVQRTVTWDDLIYVPTEYVRSDAQQVRAGDILISMSNSLELVGKCAIVSAVPTEATFGGFIAVVRPRPGINPSYVFHAMRTGRFRTHIKSVASTTTNISNINSSKLLAAQIPIVGRQAQERVVSKIDELFSRIEEGEQALKRVEELVERYRQSVLKAAVTGELTRDWREARKRAGDPVESGEALLARILKARRAAWEAAELAKLKAKGKAPTDDRWKQRYIEPQPPDTTILPDLPKGWVWTSLDMIADITGGITVDAKRAGSDCVSVPYLRVANVQRGYLDLSEIKSLLAPPSRIDALKLQPGDILFNEGGDLDKLGRGWIWEGQIPVCIHQNHVFRARLVLSGPWPKLVSWYANEMGRSFFLDKGKQTTNLASISLTKLKSLPVPMMAEVEAIEIESRVSAVMAAIEHHTSEIDNARSSATALRQSILKAAFSGQLVLQDPNDEPALKLLERIAAERAETAPVIRKRKKKVA